MESQEKKHIQEWDSDTPEAVRPTSRFDPLLGLNVVGLDDELVIFDPLTDRYFRLNSTGTVIWKFVAEGASVQATASQISKQYSLDKGQANDIVLSYVGELAKARLLVQKRER